GESAAQETREHGEATAADKRDVEEATAQETRRAALDEAGEDVEETLAFLPCERAADVVGETLVEEAPATLSSWPLYEIELEVKLEERRVSGRMQISLAAPETGLSSLILVEPPGERQGEDSPVRVTTVNVRQGSGETLEQARFERSGGRVEVRLPRPAHRGEETVLLLSLEGRLARRGQGLLPETMGMLRGAGGGIGVAGAVATDGTGVTLLGAHPVLAAFPDGTSATSAGAPWGPRAAAPAACQIMTLLAPPGLQAVATGEMVGEVPEPENRVRYTFVAAGARRMGALLRPVDMARHARRVGEVEVRATASSPEVAAEMSGWAAGVFRVYEQRYGAYPWRRLELVEAPMTGAMAGMRAAGLVVVNDMASSGAAMIGGLGPPGTESFVQEIAIAHQMAHQWFGEIVHAGGAEEPAIEEALAWQAVLDYTRTRHGAAAANRIRTRMVDLAYHTWRLGGGPDGPADRPLEAILQTGGPGAFLGLCDGKAPGLLEAVAEAVGRGHLRRALRRYAAEGRFGEVGRQELSAAVLEAAPAARKGRVEPLFRRWLDEARGDEDLGDSMAAVTSAAVGEIGMDLDQEMLEALLQQFLQGFGGPAGP
ncbi:MAG: hypothetical protein ACOC0J_01975, partial [Myxococcota bacterium]